MGDYVTFNAPFQGAVLVLMAVLTIPNLHVLLAKILREDTGATAEIQVST
jgi:hypothetical protein